MSHSARAQIASASAPLHAVRTSKYSADSPRFQKLDVGGDVVDDQNYAADIEKSPYPINRSKQCQ